MSFGSVSTISHACVASSRFSENLLESVESSFWISRKRAFSFGGSSAPARRKSRRVFSMMRFCAGENRAYSGDCAIAL